MTSSGRSAELKYLQESIALYWSNSDLLDLAFTHSSFGNESGDETGNNERLEYLGDSVLGLVVNDFLFHNYPEYSEGEMARIKSSAVSERTLASMALRLNLGAYLKMGKGELLSGGAGRKSNLADLFEALVAAIYLEFGLEKTREFIIKNISAEIDVLRNKETSLSPKSALQEHIQKKMQILPEYRLLSETGPAHRPHFECAVFVEGRELGRGQGHSRKIAEQAAAASALKTING